MVMVTLLGLIVAAIRIGGPPDLMDNEQQLQSAYVMDALQNGHWLCQRDETGSIESKPPVYTWLAALATLPVGKINRLSMCLPSVLGTIGVALLLQRFGAKYFGAEAGFLGAAVYLLSYCGGRQIGMERMDGLLPFTTTLTALAAFVAWRRGRGWIWFWLAAAISTLTKSPVALFVGPAGLVAMFWEPQFAPTSRRRGRLWAEHASGVLLFLLLTVGWLAASCAVMGRPVFQKLIIDELFGQSLHAHKGRFPGELFFAPPFYLLTRFLPWSLLAGVNLWRSWRHPAEEAKQHVFQRFVACWLVIGLIPFCIFTHMRADLIAPIIPPAALLAGREVARLIQACADRWRAAILTSAVMLALLALAYKYDYAARNNTDVAMTLAIRNLAGSLQQKVGPDFPLTHVDDPYALQYYLNTMRPDASYATAARLLGGDAAAYVVVCQPELLKLHDSPGGNRVYDLARTPSLQKQPRTHILSNRPTFQVGGSMAMAVGELQIRTDGLRWLHAAERDFTFAGIGSATFTNTSKIPLEVRVVLETADRTERLACILQPGEVRGIASGPASEGRANGTATTASFRPATEAKADPG